MTAHLLTLVIALPLIGPLVVLLVPNRNQHATKLIKKKNLVM